MTGGSFAGDELVAKCPQMAEIFRTIAKVADYKTTVLITGESGVGKERIARALHAQSSRRDGSFVAINCGAIPESLLESELFGHKKGAFTDAHADRRGLFEEAHLGTLFLDEIGELPLGLQVKLLRALQDQAIRKLGDARDTPVDVRIIAASHRNLSEEMRAGRFREDLFYRLDVLPIFIPPLRERREDIEPLVELFIARVNEKLGTHIRGISPEARTLLTEHGWPGNVRELENTIEHAMVLAEGEILNASDFSERLRASHLGDRKPCAELDPVQAHLASGELSIKKTTQLIEEVLIRRALQKTQGNRTRAAAILEISHRALLYKIKDYKIVDW